MTVHFTFKFSQAVIFHIIPQQQDFRSIIHSPMFLLTDVYHILHIRKAFTLQMTAFAGFQFRKHRIRHLHKITVLFTIDDTKCMHIGILAEILQLGLLIIRIHRDVYRTNLGTSIQQCQPIGHVPRPNTDMSTTFHTNSDQSFRHIIHTLVKLAPCKTKITVGINDIFLIGSLFSPMFQPLPKSTFK